MPIRSSDPKMDEAMARAVEAGNLTASTDEAEFEAASVAIVDIGLDLDLTDRVPAVDFSGLRSAIRQLASRMQPGALILVETTVPPGTCENVIAPEIERSLEERGLPAGSILLAHSYERVMPGAEYFDSIVNFWRAYAGHTEEAADVCERFLSQVVNVDDYPLTRLSSTTASELGKVLENSYRAANIAFMEEWGRLAEAVGVDIFEVIEAIRLRPTHSNMRQPGFGVGGYCLTKDPLFAQYAAQELLGRADLEFPFSEMAVRLNAAMPLVTLDKLDELLGGLQGKRLLLLGVSYRDGVADARRSPSIEFLNRARERGAEVVAHDPLITDSDDVVPGGIVPGGIVSGEVPSPKGFDAVVFAVPHPQYLEMDVREWLGSARPLLVDANAVLSTERLREIAKQGCHVWSIGRGSITA